VDVNRGQGLRHRFSVSVRIAVEGRNPFRVATHPAAVPKVAESRTLGAQGVAATESVHGSQFGPEPSQSWRLQSIDSSDDDSQSTDALQSQEDLQHDDISRLSIRERRPQVT
jgi:hypothetical protein